MINRGNINRIHLGDRVYLDETVLFCTYSGDIYIQENTFIAARVSFVSGHHDYTRKDSGRTPTMDNGFDIFIGKDVWIGIGAIIVGPVKIGDHAVIGAGSVVTHDVPAGELWAGNPARKIKEIAFR